jgi:hypothetical protein
VELAQTEVDPVIADVVGRAATFIDTLELDAVHGAFEIVHVRMYVPAPPAGVKVATGLVVVVNCANDVLGPEVIVHAPVPTVGELAANVTAPPTQILCVLPANEVDGFRLNVIVTSEVEGVQGALLIVQRKTYVVPAVPLNGDVGLAAFAKDPPVPLTIVHAPVPTVGVLAARVTDVSPHVKAPV